MYTIYTTPGFVISSRTYGEAGRLLHIFTRDLGLILVGAQGVRLEKSKLRYFSQEFSFGEYSVVRGKELWRLTDAKGLEPYQPSMSDLDVKISVLLKRLLQGEDSHPELFEVIYRAAILQKDAKGDAKIDVESLQTLESIIVVRILHRLGYIGSEGELDSYIQSDDISVSLLNDLKIHRTTLNKHINKALKESHL